MLNSNYFRPKYILQPLIIVQILVILSSFISETNAAKILFVIGIASHSHRVALQPLATRLAEIGHEVTFFSTIKPEVKNPNITEFCPEGLSEFNEKLTKEHNTEPVIDRMKNRHSNVMFEGAGQLLWDLLLQVNEITIKSPDFNKWVENTKFDLVIKEQLGNEFAFQIAHKHGAKVIAFAPSPLFQHEPDVFGYPTETASFSGWYLDGPYSFIPAHFYSEFKTLQWYFYFKWMYLPRVDSLFKQVFNEDLPPVEESFKATSLVLMNTHFSNEYARSLPPFLVQVGGMHVQDSSKTKPLPKAINEFIHVKGNDGFIFISFGSLARISALPDEMRKNFFDAIASFENARFLIKWDDEIPANMPTNVLPLKWFPQQDVLAHPKCRGFVSQGGLISFQQATYAGVPVIIVPIFGDQPYNARVATYHGNGIHLELADISLESLKDALSQLLYNKTLAAQAKEVGRRFKDRPMSPVDTAVWWTEYVLRHDDATHLKPLGINQEWWQRRLLDFWGIVFAVILVFTLIIGLSIRSLVRVCRASQNKSLDKLKTH